MTIGKTGTAHQTPTIPRSTYRIVLKTRNQPPNWAATTRAFHKVHDEAASATWYFPLGSTTLVATTPRAHDLLLETDSITGLTFLELAWTAFVNLDTALTRDMERWVDQTLGFCRLMVGERLLVEHLRAAAAEYEGPDLARVLEGAVLSALFMGDGVYIGEAGIFEVRFSQHGDPAHGSKRLIEAKHHAHLHSVPIEAAVILVTPSSVPTTFRHVHDRSSLSRAREPPQLPTSTRSCGTRTFSRERNGSVERRSRPLSLP